ncbi:MAG: DNA polymerase III subunit delta' [Bacteroidota bacterium]
MPTVLAQDRALGVLRRALASDRVPHAYLFHGPDGTGKRAAALLLAQALECENRGRTVPDDQPCGQCVPCTKVERLLHPDVKVYFPRPKDASTEDVTARLQRLAANPYAEVDYRRRPSLDDPESSSNKQALYSVAFTREIMREQRFTPAEGRYKVALLVDVDAMNQESANAFLKLLEEPPPRTVFVGTCERPDRLLPTILSRCQRLRFDPLPPVAIEQALTATVGLDAQRAAFLARLADGSFTRALTLNESTELGVQRALVVQFMRKAYTHNPAEVLAAAEEVGRLGRERVKGWLALLLTWVRDLVLVQAAGEQAPIVNVDQRDAIQKFVAFVPRARLDVMTAQIEQAVELAGRNVALPLVLNVLAGALHDAMHGRPRAALFAPLTQARAVH